MNKTSKINKNPGAASNSPLSLLNVSDRFQKLLKKNGMTNIGDLAMRIEENPKAILAIEGIGPKTLLTLKAALESFSPDDKTAEELHPPVQSLGDQFRLIKSTEDKGNNEDKKIKEVKKDKKAKKSKKAKKNKKTKKNKSAKKDKKAKKGKKAKKNKKAKKK